uniref:Uncharacterized protein n=1 Tax=Chromera velia CCMP2878 TaxID=1169474 RepID=A0A0G4H9K8_9ALVE|eukprot:Cvel_25321.t1-p1 / transcript=Cvel_25321.t1 / gene=Cvel_25321 / organism=Chromera_velia_CCMP2878 / gene_product=hypothetical protein / transcript_product=hypothetical protein / location=Cvel_scaffold2852:16327-22533(-) / protein_length=659 / sequence_SO=supercontig / SO=protein_coding / is_pseudo=false
MSRQKGLSPSDLYGKGCDCSCSQPKDGRQDVEQAVVCSQLGEKGLFRSWINQRGTAKWSHTKPREEPNTAKVQTKGQTQQLEKSLRNMGEFFDPQLAELRARRRYEQFVESRGAKGREEMYDAAKVQCVIDSFVEENLWSEHVKASREAVVERKRADLLRELEEKAEERRRLGALGSTKLQAVMKGQEKKGKKLQAVMKGFLARCRVERMKRGRARLHACLRGYRTRALLRRAQTQQLAALMIQRTWMRLVCLRHCAALNIQAAHLSLAVCGCPLHQEMKKAHQHSAFHKRTREQARAKNIAQANSASSPNARSLMHQNKAVMKGGSAAEKRLKLAARHMMGGGFFDVSGLARDRMKVHRGDHLAFHLSSPVTDAMRALRKDVGLNVADANEARQRRREKEAERERQRQAKEEAKLMQTRNATQMASPWRKITKPPTIQYEYVPFPQEEARAGGEGSANTLAGGGPGVRFGFRPISPRKKVPGCSPSKKQAALHPELRYQLATNTRSNCLLTAATVFAQGMQMQAAAMPRGGTTSATAGGISPFAPPVRLHRVEGDEAGSSPEKERTVRSSQLSQRRSGAGATTSPGTLVYPGPGVSSQRGSTGLEVGGSKSNALSHGGRGGVKEAQGETEGVGGGKGGTKKSVKILRDLPAQEDDDIL